MLHQVIDRRLSGKNKSIANRERFLKRYRAQIRRSVTDAVNERSITDIEKGRSVTIPKKGTSEPTFRHGQGGSREMVHTGNEEYIAGDRIARPPRQGGGGGGGQASGEGESEDSFTFELSREEFMNYFFEDLELPRLVKTTLTATPSWRSARAGYSNDGTPNNIDLVRSLRNSIGRRIALGGAMKTRLIRLETQLKAMRADPEALPGQMQDLEEQVRRLRARVLGIPFIDPFDLRYVNRTRMPVPSSKAVMFCVMDVSGSMDAQRKDLSKRFFILLYLFLTRNYTHTEVVFIRHHTRADEVDEHTFFHSQESGGTVVSSALELMQKIISDRYPPGDWNIYGAQASDGDNWNDDSLRCRTLLEQQILPACRYYAYVQVAAEEQNLWTEYRQVAASHAQFAMKKVQDAAGIYPVFRELFEKQRSSQVGP